MTGPSEVEILLVEDNPSDVELTLRALKARNLANQVFIARDGAEALEFFFGEQGHPLRDFGVTPRVILLDLKLPKVDGLEVLRRLKGDERTRALPVVVLTSSKEEPDITAAYRLGANSYIVKPVDFEAFARAVDRGRARTEQARAEEARRQGEERFRALIEHGADAVALVAPDGTLLFASHSIERLLGFAPAELVGHPGFERVHPDDAPRLHAALRDIITSPGTPASLELRWRHKDGSWRHIDAVAVDRLAEPAVGAIVVNFRDVSERRTAEAALRESEERYRTLVEGVRDIIFALSPEGTIASLNPAFETITGLRREEWVGQPFERLVHPEDLPLALELLGRVVRGELRPASQFRGRTAKGDYRVGEVSATPQLHEGPLVGLLGVGRGGPEGVP